MRLHLLNCNGPDKIYTSSILVRKGYNETKELITITEHNGTTQSLELTYTGESFLQILHDLYKHKEMKGHAIFNY